MNRPTKPETVALSWGDWVRLYGLIIGLVAAAWAFTMDISGELRATQAEVRLMREMLNKLETRLQRLEDRR